LQGIKEPNLIPSREFKSRSGEFGAPLEMPIREPDMHMGQRGLGMNENQVKESQGNATSPRWGWSGACEIVPPLWAEAELRRVICLLPSRQSSIEDIVAELQAIGGRYHRYLHQDEFGPTRAERMQALRDLLVPLGVLSSRLESLSPQLGLLLSEGFLEYRSSAEQLDDDPVACYSADKTVIDVVSESASDLRRTLVGVGRTDEANLIGEICAAADAIAPMLWNLDTTTDADVAIEAGSAGPEPTNNSADPFIAVSAAVRRLCSRFELAFTRLRRRKGPEARLSLVLLARELCDLWRRETGRPVTSNPVRQGAYTGRPQSASGRFVCEAVEALQPTAAWIDEHVTSGAHMRAAIMTRGPGGRVQAVNSALRGYVATDRGDPSAPRRGRPRRK
jgi:hypothetical protein